MPDSFGCGQRFQHVVVMGHLNGRNPLLASGAFNKTVRLNKSHHRLSIDASLFKLPFQIRQRGIVRLAFLIRQIDFTH
ncbi:MAG: hypothetical protein AAGJ40_09495 [Planctomycetota bacterium]